MLRDVATEPPERRGGAPGGPRVVARAGHTPSCWPSSCGSSTPSWSCWSSLRRGLAVSPLLAHYDTVGMLWWQLDSTRGSAAVRDHRDSGLLRRRRVRPDRAGRRPVVAGPHPAEPREEELEARVTELRHSRINLVDAFETERRRIERDLHDGVQQRLVALTMTLGRAEMDVPPGEGLDLVSQAHREAEEALADLRRRSVASTRGCWSTTGSAAAVREVADRTPIPVRSRSAWTHACPRRSRPRPTSSRAKARQRGQALRRPQRCGGRVGPRRPARPDGHRRRRRCHGRAGERARRGS